MSDWIPGLDELTYYWDDLRFLPCAIYQIFPWIVAAVAVFGAAFSAAYSFRYIAHVFLGPKRDDYPHKPHDPGPGLWLSPAFLVVLVVPLTPQGGWPRTTHATWRCVPADLPSPQLTAGHADSKINDFPT